MAEIVRVHPNQAGSEQYGRMSPGGCITIYVLHTHSHVLQAVITSHVNICDLLDAPYLGTAPTRYPNEVHLSVYTRATGKTFPRRGVLKKSLLEYLLRHIMKPQLRRGTRHPGRGRGSRREGKRGVTQCSLSCLADRVYLFLAMCPEHSSCVILPYIIDEREAVVDESETISCSVQRPGTTHLLSRLELKESILRNKASFRNSRTTAEPL